MATVVDGGRTLMPVYSGCGSARGFHSPPPPVPARLHHVREPRPATALGHGFPDCGAGGYLAPVSARRVVAGGPPLPPRQPLRRSVSLTQRCPPQPRTTDSDAAAGGLLQTPDHPAAHEPTLDEVLASLRRSRVDSTHPAPLSPALSAPLLGQVFDSSYTQHSRRIGSRPSDHYFRSVCLSVCLFVQSFSQPSLIRFRSN